MTVAIITGSAGLIGSESVEFFSSKFDHVIGIDNNMRAVFFGEDASIQWNIDQLNEHVGNYVHHSLDIRDEAGVAKVFREFNTDIQLVLHTAAQPSHDWAASAPITDFTVNANGTLNLLENTRQHCPDAVFIFTSTNKVYGDRPNALPLIELDTRWEVEEDHRYYKNGIDESMSIDDTQHSLFGASKVAADVLVQEYAKYFGIQTGVFRGGCLTGPKHSGTQLHGFLSYLMRCVITGDPYVIYGYKGKQVRDNIHSRDLINMFWEFYRSPVPGVYNVGGSRHSNCSMLEAIDICEEIAGKKLNFQYSTDNRVGDHIWWISDISRFQSAYPNWRYHYNLYDILTQIHGEFSTRLVTR